MRPSSPPTQPLRLRKFGETVRTFPAKRNTIQSGLWPRPAGANAGYGRTPKSATDGKAIELLWQAAEELLKTAELPEANTRYPTRGRTPGGSDKEAQELALNGKSARCPHIDAGCRPCRSLPCDHLCARQKITTRDHVITIRDLVFEEAENL
jgi:hypothetical protein